MGTRGPSPTPTRVLELRGSWRANARPGEPKPDAARPKPPKWLGAEARQAFLYLSRQLDAMGVLTRLDQNALARYVTLWVRYRKAEAFIEKHGDTYVVRGKPGPNGEPAQPVGFETHPSSGASRPRARPGAHAPGTGVRPDAFGALAALGRGPVPDKPTLDYFKPLESTG